jgi:hypothetical protein
MKKSEMVCNTCIKFEGTQCRLDPEVLPVNDPENHWCAQGQWQEWSERYQEMEPFYWGEWEENCRETA